jgi:hypothetical protein
VPGKAIVRLGSSSRISQRLQACTLPDTTFSSEEKRSFATLKGDAEDLEAEIVVLRKRLDSSEWGTTDSWFETVSDFFMDAHADMSRLFKVAAFAFNTHTNPLSLFLHLSSSFFWNGVGLLLSVASVLRLFSFLGAAHGIARRFHTCGGQGEDDPRVSVEAMVRRERSRPSCRPRNGHQYNLALEQGATPRATTTVEQGFHLGVEK